MHSGNHPGYPPSERAKASAGLCSRLRECVCEQVHE
jgi:hypothetical protein